MPGIGARSRMRSAKGTRGMDGRRRRRRGAGGGGGGGARRVRLGAPAPSRKRAPLRWCRRAFGRSISSCRPSPSNRDAWHRAARWCCRSASSIHLVGDAAGGLLGGLDRHFVLLGEASTRSISWSSALSISPILASCVSARVSCLAISEIWRSTGSSERVFGISRALARSRLISSSRALKASSAGGIGVPTEFSRRWAISARRNSSSLSLTGDGGVGAGAGRE